MKIGELAQLAEVSCRTLRYYEELGLVTPHGHSVGGARRYSKADLDRILRIRRLQSLMHLDLEEIGSILAAEDRIEAIREEYRHSQPSLARRIEILEEALEITTWLLGQVESRMSGLVEFKDELSGRMKLYLTKLDELKVAPRV